MDQPSQEPGAPTDAGPTGLEPDEPQQPEPQDVASLPEWAQKLISKGNNQAAGYRTKYQTAAQQAQEAQAQRDKMLAALGLTPEGDEAPNPERLGAQLDQFRAQAWETAVENRILRLAPKLGVDADALLDSVAFLDSLADADIDPASPDFAQQLEAHVAGFVGQRQKFRTVGPSGGDAFGAPTQQPTSLDAQIRAAESKGDWATARQLKTQRMLNK